jgi:hypothetical protein
MFKKNRTKIIYKALESLEKIGITVKEFYCTPELIDDMKKCIYGFDIFIDEKSVETKYRIKNVVGRMFGIKIKKEEEYETD